MVAKVYDLQPFKAYRLLYVPAGLTLKILHGDYIAFICFFMDLNVTFALYIINLLAPELFFLILAHPVYKM